jgi:two-component system CheB/CheR fusion protein
LASLHVAVIVLDQQVTVRVWNHRAEDLWGLRQEEVRGKHFLNLDIGLPVDQLKNGIRSCILGEADFQEVVLEAVNRRGKAIACKVACSPLLTHEERARGAILLMEEVAPTAGAKA